VVVSVVEIVIVLPESLKLTVGPTLEPLLLNAEPTEQGGENPALVALACAPMATVAILPPGIDAKAGMFPSSLIQDG
jgi:hypothetical protein